MSVHAFHFPTYSTYEHSNIAPFYRESHHLQTAISFATMSGLEILGTVAASVEVVKTIRSSLVFLRDIRNTPKHLLQQSDLHHHLLVQAEVFESWRESIGITDFERSENTKDLQNSVDLQRRLE